MKLCLSFILAFFADLAIAQNSPCYWSGQLVKCFPTSGIALSGTQGLSVGTTNQFVLGSTGNITTLNNVTTSFPATQGANHTTLHNDSTGTLAWSLVDLANDLTGILPVANGGTGLASGTSGGIIGYTAAGTLASSALLPQNGVVIGAGAGATPTGTAAGSAYQPFRVPSGGGAPAFGALDISQGAATTGMLPVSSGGAAPATKTLWVDGTRTDSYTATGSFSLPFKTIMGAVNQIITNADNATHAYAIQVAVANYNETVTLSNALLYNLSFVANTLGNAETSATSFGPGTGTALTSTATNTHLQDLSFTGFTISGDVILTGDVNGTNFCGTSCVFHGCNIITDVAGMQLNNVNNLYFYDTAYFPIGAGTLLFKNIAFGLVEQGDGIKDGSNVVLTDAPGSNTPAQYSGNYLLVNRSTFYATTATIDAGSELDITQSYVNGSMSNSGILHTWQNFWENTLTINSGGSLRTQGDTFRHDFTASAGSTVTTLGAMYSSNYWAGYPGTTAGKIFVANGGGSGANATIQNLGATTAYNFNLPTTAGSSGQVLTSAGGAASSMTWTTPTTGTVTSVGFASPGGIFGQSGTPVTTSGTLTETVAGTSGGIPYFSTTSNLASSALLTNHAVVTGGGTGAAPVVVTNNASAANEFLTQSSSGAPAWAALVSGDIPNNAANTSGTASNITGIAAPANGGTGIANNAASTLTISGNFATTMTVSGTTSVTLPTSGTLINNTQNTSGTSSNITGVAAIANGGTAVTSVTVAPAATAFAGWDANKNLSANNHIEGYTTTATAAGTTTLLVGSTYQQFFTGSTTQTVLLPVTSTLVLGQQYQVINNSSGAVTVQSSGANTVQVMGANSAAVFTVVLTSGTTAASWNVEYNSAAGGTVTSVALTSPGGIFNAVTGGPITTSGTLVESVTGTSGGIPYFSSNSALSSSGALTANAVIIGGGAGGAPTAVTNNGTANKAFLNQTSSGTPQYSLLTAADIPVATTGANGGITLKAPTQQTFTTGTNATYTTAAGVLWIRIRAIGGGGGGAGGGSGAPTSGGAGGTTCFGGTSGCTGSNITNTGGGAGTSSSGTGSNGGTSTISGCTGINFSGGGGGAGNLNDSISTNYELGGFGGNGAFGGGGRGGLNTDAGVAGATATGAGGGGGGSGLTVLSAISGSGGAAGGYADCIISAPAGTYLYSVGAGGTAGSAGTTGGSGSTGGSGLISVEEHYY